MFLDCSCGSSVGNRCRICFAGNILIPLSSVELLVLGLVLLMDLLDLFGDSGINFVPGLLRKLNVVYVIGNILLSKALLTHCPPRGGSHLLWLLNVFFYLFSFLGLVQLLKLLIASTRITLFSIVACSIILSVKRSHATGRNVSIFWKSKILSFFVSRVL